MTRRTRARGSRPERKAEEPLNRCACFRPQPEPLCVTNLCGGGSHNEVVEGRDGTQRDETIPMEEEGKEEMESGGGDPNMKVIAAFLLALLGGNPNPTADDLKAILGSVGAEADEDMIKLLLDQVKGKDPLELIASGREKLASVPSGGGGGGGVAVAAAPASGGGAAAAAPAEEAPKKEEKVEESDDDMGFSLFD
ncbi:60S acidic ribosomal protein P2A-like [Tripterygium wilfordii]|uniref:60S acidic ribosomal protein P2A-like n=2 Tax=Tripterygium wilfordii TaxID=458696 RepID=A0A7J7DYX9_TRIWF|nr:60S acidic ribosomal protein P2A-like [Tripterygium wilfordii]